MRRTVAYFRQKREDILLFVASLSIAVLLFIQLQPAMATGREREIEVPLVFAGMNESLTVVQAPRSVKAIATGSQEALDSLDTSRVRAVVDLSAATFGPGRYRVEIIGPARSKLVFTPIRTLEEIGVERRVTTEFEVILSALGTPPEGVFYDGATVSPTRVRVQGPASSMDGIKVVRAVLDISELAPGRHRNLELEALDANGRPVPLVSFEPRTVTVSPALTFGPSRRKLLVTPIFEGQPPFGYRIESYTVEPNQIDATGESQLVSKVTTVNTDPIDLRTLKSSRTISVRIRLPRGVNSIGDESVNVSIVIRKT